MLTPALTCSDAVAGVRGALDLTSGRTDRPVLPMVCGVPAPILPPQAWFSPSRLLSAAR